MYTVRNDMKQESTTGAKKSARPTVQKATQIKARVATKKASVSPRPASKKPRQQAPKSLEDVAIELPDTINAQATGRKKRSTTKTEEVTLPANMSQRVITKSIAMMEVFDKDFGAAMYRIAYVCGLCFIVFGAAYASLTFVPNSAHLKAELITVSDTSTTDPNTTNTTSGTTVSPDSTETTNPSTVDSGSTQTVDTVPTTVTQPVYGRSEFSFLTTVPKNVIEPTPVSFYVTNAEKILPSLVIIGKTGFVSLPYDRVSVDKYRVIIPADKLAPDYYELRIYIKPLDGTATYARVTNKFFVGSEDVERWYNDQKNTDTNSDSGQTTSSGTENTTTDTEVKTGDTANDVTSTEEDEDLTTTSESDTEDPVLQPKTSTDEPKTAEQPEITLSSPNGSTLKEVSTLWVAAPADASLIELYARPVNGLNAQFVTLATKRFDRWVFAFDTTNIPNGEYEFFAKTKLRESLLSSRSIRLTVDNIKIVKIEPATTIVPVEERELITIDSEPFQPTTILEDSVRDESVSLLAEHETDLNELLRRYAVAIQTGDPSLIQAAKNALESKREAIALTTIQDQRVRDISDNISTELTNQISVLQQRVEIFEEMRKERSSGTTAIDTDGDGISDVDELKLYGTDAENPDSDGDGINDGVEIMRGYDPLDDRSEAVIRFQSPKESLAVVRSDVLEVTEVIPLAQADATPEQPPVVAEIRGRGLPNSFVTLYIFSMPTVVTVRTDADGSFVYTFDKELEDGRHDVYVAVTDNAGEIVARSNPFSFVKQAEAFTPVAAAEANVLTPDSIEENAAGGYGLVVGMGILSLGLILLMLGISLRLKREDEVVITEQPVTPA